MTYEEFINFCGRRKECKGNCRYCYDCYLDEICDISTEADRDDYAVQVQNGDGYYDDFGRFHRYYDGD